jgi:membrane fusion protein, protease secretion system
MQQNNTPQHGSVQADDADDAPLKTDTRTPMRLGFWVLLVGFGGFLLWAGIAPLDQGVPSQATVTIDKKRKPVQTLSGGLVEEVLVREGEMVHKGQVVAKLNSAMSTVNFEANKQRYMGFSATQSRLLAEQSGGDSVSFERDVMQSKDPLVKQQVETQRTLFAARKAALQSDTNAIRHSIEGQLSFITGLKGQIVSNQQQLELFQKELRAVRELASEGYAPQTRIMELERQVAAAEGRGKDLVSSIARSQSAIGESEQRIAQRQQEYRKEVDNLLAQIRMEYQSNLERYKASSEELERTQVKAPVDGQVVGLQIQVVGAVLQPAQKLMDIVPQDEKLVLEAKIQPNYIDKIKEGQFVDVRFSTFANTPQLVVQGRLESISRDTLAEAQMAPGSSPNYYLARVELTEEGIRTLQGRLLQPGMQAEVMIKTGERSFLKYLLHPLIKRMATSMKEE